MFGKDRASGNSTQDTDRANAMYASGSPDASIERVNETPLGVDEHLDGVGGNTHGTSDELTDSVHRTANAPLGQRRNITGVSHSTVLSMSLANCTRTQMQDWTDSQLALDTSSM